MAHFTSAMPFAPVHGGCYIISSVGIEYSCGIFHTKMGGWAELYPHFFGICLTLQSPLVQFSQALANQLEDLYVEQTQPDEPKLRSVPHNQAR